MCLSEKSICHLDHQFVSFITALIMSLFDSRRALIASLRVQLVWSITMSMWPGVRPSSDRGASLLEAPDDLGADALDAA